MLDAYEDPEEAAERFREAESWRLAGCFKRGEVNATRSGQSACRIAQSATFSHARRDTKVSLTMVSFFRLTSLCRRDDRSDRTGF